MGKPSVAHFVEKLPLISTYSTGDKEYLVMKYEDVTAQVEVSDKAWQLAETDYHKEVFESLLAKLQAKLDLNYSLDEDVSHETPKVEEEASDKAGEKKEDDDMELPEGGLE